MAGKNNVSKDKLVKSARDLFRHQGFHKTTIDDISEASGLNRGSIYFYFKGKEELAQAALDHALEREFILIESLMSQGKDPLDKLHRMIDGIVRFNADRNCKGGCLFGNFALELGDTNPELARSANRFFVQWKALIVSLLDQAQEANQFSRDVDLDAFAHTIMSMIEGTLLISRASGDVDTFVKAGESIRDMVRAHTKPAKKKGGRSKGR